MHSLSIALFSLMAVIGYGILHDQITARVCLEYFTLGHAPVFQTTSPTLLALGWGVLATWWAGLPLGIVLATCCRMGTWPKLTVHQLIVPWLTLLTIMGLCAMLAGHRGLVRAGEGKRSLPAPLSEAVPADKHARFIADWQAHTASYAVGSLGGALLCLSSVHRRWRRQIRSADFSPADQPESRAGA